MHLINKILLLCVLTLFVLSCKKEPTDTIAPEVSIESPLFMSNYFSVDTILVSAIIYDNEVVKSVIVKLISGDGEVFASIPEILPMSSELNYNQFLILERPDMLQGQYFLEVAASDGINTTKQYKEIVITPVPLVLNATYISSGSMNSQEIFSWAENEISNVLNNAEDVVQLHTNNFEEELIVVTGVDGRVRAYNFPDNDLQWVYSIENNTPFRSITTSYYYQDEEELLLGDSDGFARILNNAGSVVLGFQSNQNLYKPVNSVLTESRVVFVERRLDGSDQNFNLYYRSSGELDLRLFLEGIVVDMFPDHSTSSTMSTDKIVLFVNKTSGPELKVFHQNGGGFSVPINLPSGNLISACKIGRERYVFQIDNTVYHYGFSGQLQIYLQGAEPFVEMKYDKLNNILICTTSSGVYQYAVQGGLQFLGTIPLMDAKHISLLYNR